jgi:hypothetical protein
MIIRSDPNLLSNWFPALLSAGLPVPKTSIIKTDAQLLEYLDGKVPEGGPELIRQIAAAGDEIGWPLFLRTGLTSAKHRWKRSCYVENRDVLLSHVIEIVEFSACADFLGLDTSEWCVRELLPTIPYFHAFDGFPVVEEYRVFWIDGEVRCIHPYWPRESIRSPSAEDWRDLLEGASTLLDLDRAEILELAQRVGAVTVGDWSIDFLCTDRGWYVTDMAVASQSFHWPGCPNGPKEMEL